MVASNSSAEGDRDEWDDAYTVEEMRAILASLSGLSRVVMALSFLGLRPAEMAGLRWNDIHANRLNVQRGLWRKHITAGKTGARFVPAGPFVLGILREYRDSREFHSGHVLENSEGGPLDTHGIYSFVNRTLKPVFAKLSFEWKQLYGGRVHYGTLARSRKRALSESSRSRQAARGSDV